MNGLLALQTFENIGIATGYLLVGFVVLPRATEFIGKLIPFVTLSLTWTALGGTAFLVGCAGTHVEVAMHLALTPDSTVTGIANTWHMHLVHAVQFVGVWTLILGAYFEFVRPVQRALTVERRTP